MILSELSSIVPVRMVAIEPRPRFMWLKTAVTDGSLALLLNAAIAALVIHDNAPWRFPKRPDAIAVELVKDIPKSRESTDKGPSSQPTADATRPADPTPDGGGEHTASQQRPDMPEAPAPEPVRPVAPVSAPTPPPDPVVPPPTATARVTPPLDQSTNDAKPHLVEAPPDPHNAAQQSDAIAHANAAIGPTETATPQRSPPQPAPDVMSAPDQGDLAADTRAVLSEPPKSPPTPEEQREAANTAKLAAALPFSTRFVPEAFRAAVAGSGEAGSALYRGAVYGAFRKADALIEDARSKHLRGQAVIRFTLDDKGGLTAAAVAVSSGDPAVDDLALEIVQKSAPYPPPPPGAQRSFAPVIRIGLDDE